MSLMDTGCVPSPSVKLPRMWKSGMKGLASRAWHCSPCLHPALPGSQVGAPVRGPSDVPSTPSAGHWLKGAGHFWPAAGQPPLGQKGPADGSSSAAQPSSGDMPLRPVPPPLLLAVGWGRGQQPGARQPAAGAGRER